VLDLHLGHLAGRSDRRRDLGIGQGGLEPKGEDAIEDILLERRRGRPEPTHRPQRFRLAQRQEGARAPERGRGIDGHPDPPAAPGHRPGRFRFDLRRGRGRPGLRGDPCEFGEQAREIEARILARRRRLHRLVQGVHHPEEQVGVLPSRGGRVAEPGQRGLGAMGQLGQVGVAHRRRHALEGVHGAEQRHHRFRRGRIPLPLQQRAAAGRQLLAAFGEEEGGVARGVHGLSPGLAAPPRAPGMAGTV
jgi:hypothetical protein